jgi:2-dehydro-3-deoxy-D-gluconate 5-dehydrogenase
MELRHAAARFTAKAVLADRRVDILVDNAGTIRRGRAADLPPGERRAVLDVNRDALFSQLMGALLARGNGKTVNVASIPAGGGWLAR